MNIESLNKELLPWKTKLELHKPGVVWIHNLSSGSCCEVPMSDMPSTVEGIWALSEMNCINLRRV